MTPPRVVVVGGGFAGLYLAGTLGNQPDQASPLLRSRGGSLDRQGRVLVEADCSVSGRRAERP